MMETKSFTLDEQRAFADLSGDRNPMHVDPIAARRLLFGKPIVHGINLLFWAFDRVLTEKCSLRSLTAQFASPVAVGVAASLEVRPRQGSTEILVNANGSKAAAIKVSFQEPLPALDVSDKHPPPADCLARQEHDYANAAGALELMIARVTLQRLYPSVTEKLPAHQLAILLATTRLVGMTCPGLYSIYRELKLSFTASIAGATPELKWAVTEYDSRFNAVDMTIDAPGAQGSIMAFVRPAPVRQPSMADLREIIPANWYASQTALIVGGSRGLGELTAKMLATGGADVYVTYHNGRNDAEAVVNDIRSSGGKAEALAFDVCGEDGAPFPRAVTHVYYFATPHIGAAAKDRFQADLFERFRRFYADGLERTVELAATGSEAGLKVFYPSSVFVSEPPPDMAEYVAAKKLGEALCREMMEKNSKLDIHIARLPRMATDQTVSLIPVDYADALVVMKGVLDEMK